MNTPEPPLEPPEYPPEVYRCRICGAAEEPLLQLRNGKLLCKSCLLDTMLEMEIDDLSAMLLADIVENE